MGGTSPHCDGSVTFDGLTVCASLSPSLFVPSALACHTRLHSLGVTKKSVGTSLPAVSLLSSIHRQGITPKASHIDQPRCDLTKTNTTQSINSTQTPQQWAPSHLAYDILPPHDQRHNPANTFQFNSVVNAITSCFMAIVNGIVTVIKAIINVSQHHAKNNKTTTARKQLTSILPGHRRLLLPPRQLPHLRQGRRPSEDDERCLEALSTRCRSDPHITLARMVWHRERQAGSAFERRRKRPFCKQCPSCPKKRRATSTLESSFLLSLLPGLHVDMMGTKEGWDTHTLDS